MSEEAAKHVILAEVFVVEKHILRKCWLLSNCHRKWWLFRIDGLKGAEDGHRSVETIVKD